MSITKRKSVKDPSPCGIAHRANNSTSVKSVFHGASRKDAKQAKSGKIRKLTFFAPRLSQINLRPISLGLRLIRLSPRLIRPLADSGGALAFRPVGPPARRARKFLFEIRLLNNCSDLENSKLLVGYKGFELFVKLPELCLIVVHIFIGVVGIPLRHELTVLINFDLRTFPRDVVRNLVAGLIGTL